MKMLLIFLWGISAFAGWQEYDCNQITSAGKKAEGSHREILFNHNSSSSKYISGISYKIISSFHKNEGCSYEIRSKDGKTIYDFNSNGEISYTTLGPSYSQNIFVETQSKSPRLFVNPENGEVKILLQNAAEIYFDPSSARIDTSKSKGLDLSYNGNEIKINKSDKPVFNLGRVSGDSNKNNVNGSLTIHHKENSCRAKTKNLFNFRYVCKRSKQQGGHYIDKLCQTPAKDIWESLRGSGRKPEKKFIEGISLKANYKQKLRNLGKKRECVFLDPSKQTELKTPNCMNELQTYFRKELKPEAATQFFKNKAKLGLLKVNYMSSTIQKIPTEKLKERIGKLQKLLNKKVNNIFDNNLLLQEPNELKVNLFYFIQRYKKTVGEDQQVELNKGDLKLLLILLNESEKSGGRFYKSFPKLLNTQQASNNQIESKKAQVLELQKEIELQQEEVIDYLLKKGCTTLGDFTGCKKHNQGITPEVLFDDNVQVIEQLYRNILKR